MIVELIPQYADVDRNGMRFREEVPQKLVFVNGNHVGYIGTHAGAPLNLFEQLDEAERIDLQAEIRRQLSWQPSHVSMAPERPIEQEEDFDEED